MKYCLLLFVYHLAATAFDSPEFNQHTQVNGSFCAETAALLQIVGTYSESASDDQNAALKQVALTKPDAPSKDELKSMGYDFALKV